jgi:hypothetical protein
MAIDIEKILTVTATEYCESVGKPLSDYLLVGVHGCHNIREFSEEVPDGADVIVNHRLDYPGYHYGTALVPKDYKPKEPESLL